MPYLHLPIGSRLYYQSNGRGRPVVFIHAWSASHALWGELAPELAPICHTLVYDQRGHGRSDRPTGPYTIDAYTQDLAQLLRALQLDDVVLVGWSMGVIVALNYFRRFGGERVGKLVLLSGSPCLLQSPEWPHGFDEAELHALALSLAEDRVGATCAFLGSLIAPNHRAALLDWVASVALEVPLVVALESFKSETATDVRHVLAHVHVPTLVVHGDQDHPVCRGAAGYMVSELPRARHVVLPRSGHFAPLEAPRALGASLREFVIDESLQLASAL
jgi:non-heme chloroperoxidase